MVAPFPIATTTRHSAQQIAFNEVGRQAIMADPDWNEGNYYGKQPPARGLAVARMVGHITYMSDDSMREKFGRRLRGKENFGFGFDVDFEVESYLRYRGSQFVNRFDANSYLYITKAMDYFDLTNGNGSLAAALETAQARFLVISFSSDWLYPSYQSQEMVRALRSRNRDVAYVRAAVELRARFVPGGRGRADRPGARLPGQHVRESWHERDAEAGLRPRTAGPQRLRHHRRDRRAEDQGARPGLRRRRTAGMAGGRTRAWMRAASRSPAPRCSAPSRAASPSSRAISTKAWPTIPTRRSIT